MRKNWVIYGQKVKIKYSEDLRHPETNEPCYGLYDPTSHIIYIQKGISAKDEYETICHEIIHAMQMRLGYYQMSLSYDFLEQMAETFGKMITENFKPK